MKLVWADGGYSGRLLAWARQALRLEVVVVKRTDDTGGSTVLPRRWLVERTFAWITRNRRLIRVQKRLPQTDEAMAHLAMIMLMSRRLARNTCFTNRL